MSELDRLTSSSPLRPVLVSAYEQFAASKARGTDPAAGPAFTPETSPLHGRAIFLIGAPRSGTTWLQQLLALHPAVATAGEMHVFCEGVGVLLDNHDGNDRYSGLSGWVTRPELVALVRDLVDGIMLRLRDTQRPGATHVLDKTPNHVPYAARLAEVYPDAAYVHIVRDGRAAARSAQRLWSHSADYNAAGRNAGRWRDAVLDCREHLSGGRYVEVRYEDLLADPTGELARIYDVIGLPYDKAFLAECADFGSVPINVSPSGGSPTAAAPDLPPDAEREMLLTAGDLLVELGYVDEARRDRLVRHRSLRRTAREGAALARSTATRLRVRSASRWGQAARAQRRRHQVRRAAEQFAAALAAGDTARAQHLLAPTAALDDEPQSSPAGLADRLVDLVQGSHQVALDADEAVAAVRWADGRRNQLHRLRVDARGRIERVTVESSR